MNEGNQVAKLLQAVAVHEKGMREEAQMGVKSLRSEEAQKTSAECRLCKVALMTVTLWFMAWTPYFVINWGGMFNRPMVTPLFSIWGSVFAKANAVYNPIVYAISHPKYRAALEKKLPCLACNTEGREGGGSASGSAATTAKSNEKSRIRIIADELREGWFGKDEIILVYPIYLLK
ncbi:rhodopsin-like [Penaeus vannamei]|uniref:rhodopsin-like n=1 Tax=Penaeus vannamei TaxID=6689 RepID=UPI00387F7BB8